MGDRLTDVWGHARGAGLNFGNVSHLMGFRGTMSVLLFEFLADIRTALVFFFLLFILRAILRSQWAAGAVFAALMTVSAFFQSHGSAVIPQTIEAALLYSMIAVCAVRFGLVALVVSFFVLDTVGGLQFTTNSSAWYFPVAPAVVAAIVALAVWAFRISIGSQKLIKDDL